MMLLIQPVKTKEIQATMTLKCINRPLLFLGIATGTRLTIGDRGVVMNEILDMCVLSPELKR